MEFSFDRSRNSNSHSQPQSSTNQSNAQSASNATSAQHTDEVDTSTIANERLRKAIERNRERQRQREQQAPSQSNQSAHSSAWAQHQAHTQATNPREEMEDHVQSTLFDRQERNQVRNEEVRTESRPEPRVEETRETQRENPRETIRPRAHTRAHIRRDNQQTTVDSSQPLQTPVATRRSVAKPDDTEFAPVKRTTTKRAASQISYTTGTKKKGKELDPSLVNYLVKGAWAFCGFLVLRLLFANGGVTDYFSQRSALNQRFQELTRIKKENMALVHEIERMQLDSSYQKRLVRDNLGFIAQDEFLILFPKDQSN